MAIARSLTPPPATEDHTLRMTYEDFLIWADDNVDDTTHVEWVNGEVTVFMAPNTIHVRLAYFLAQVISLFCNRFGLGEVFVAPFEVRLGPGPTFREPDVLFVATEHLDRVDADRVNGPADLVIEIISDSSVDRDRIDKFRDYAAAGVPEYWMFDPRPGNQTTAFSQLAPDRTYRPIPLRADGRYHSLVLPGFPLDPAWLWQDPLPDPLLVLAAIAPDALRSALEAIIAQPTPNPRDA